MLKIKIELFLDYCKVSNFATRSIQSLRVRLNEFNRFINEVPVESIQTVSYRDLKEFITQYGNPSIHIKKARIWSLRQFFHFLKLNGWIKINIASDFPYPKIEKTIPHFLTIEEYNRLLNFFLSQGIRHFRFQKSCYDYDVGAPGPAVILCTFPEH